VVTKKSLIGLLLALGALQSDAGERVDLARWAAALPPRFAVHGVKTEPTYEEAIDMRRDGDVIAVVGGAPDWAARAIESVSVSRTGRLSRLPCPNAVDCSFSVPPAGFLATAALISASRQGRLSGFGAELSFGARYVVCLPAEMMGVERPILDPCFDRETGAVLAQRHRRSGRFEGASLERSSIRVD
jgi:hypothetical protein